MNLLDRCGLMLEPQEGMEAKDVIKIAKIAEDLGYGYIFRSDHLLPTSGRRGVNSPECWTTLASIAVTTKRIKFGPLVSPIGFRNPVLLAKMATTVHSISSGRLVLGLGAGWYRDEYRAFGYDFPSFEIRKDQFAEGLMIIRKLLDNGHINHTGKYYTVNTELYPRPVGKMHIIVGGRAISIVKIANYYANEWNIFSPTMDTLNKLRRHASDVMEISQMGPFFIAEDSIELNKKIRRRIIEIGYNGTTASYMKRLKEHGVIIGTISEFVEEIKDRIENGIKKFYFQILNPEDLHTIEMLADTLKRT